MLSAVTFNPFDKLFKDVVAADLQKLLTVTEGLFVEYKGFEPTPLKVAKSVASFANSHGGVLFLGVQADGKTNLALSFPGIDPHAKEL
jgi:predicted HTH transcriptional regulator